MHVPEAIAGFLEPDVFLAEDVADIDPVVMPPDPAILAHAPDFLVRRILEGQQLIGERPRRGLVDRRRWTLAQRLVRPLLVERVPEAIEGGRSLRLRLQGAMHAFVPAILFRVARLDELRPDPQAQPPHAQGESRPSAIVANGTPLSVRMRTGRPNSRNARSKKGLVSLVLTDRSARHASRKRDAPSAMVSG